MFKEIDRKVNVVLFELTSVMFKYFLSGTLGAFSSYLDENEYLFLVDLIRDQTLHYMGREWAEQGFLKSRLHFIGNTEEYKVFKRKVDKRVKEIAYHYNIENLKL